MNKFLCFVIIITSLLISTPALTEDEAFTAAEQDGSSVEKKLEPEADQETPEPVHSEKQAVSMPLEGEDSIHDEVVDEVTPPIPDAPSPVISEEVPDTPAEEVREVEVQIPEADQEATLTQAVENVQQAATQVEAAEQEAEKAKEVVEDLLSKMGDNPTPAQQEELKKTVSSFVAAAETTEKAEQKVTQARERALSVRIQDNISSNAPAEPGF